MDVSSLIARAKDGDRDAFGALYDETVRSIYGFLFFKTLRREVAEDLTSATYMKALERITKFTDRGEGSFRAWLYAIARNTYADHLRKSSRQTTLPEDMQIPEVIPSARQMEAQADLAAARRELDKLPEAQRDIIMLRVWQELSFKDIAATLGKSEASCKMMFSRAIRELRVRLPLTALLALLTFQCMKTVQHILEDLYVLDPTLREREADLIPLLTTLLAAKPEAEVNEDFAFRLRTKLMAMPNPVQTKPFFTRVPLMAALGVLGLAIVVPVVATQIGDKASYENTGDFALSISNLRDGAFGPLSASVQTSGLGGGGNESTKMSANVAGAGDAMLGSAEAMSSRMMIAPGEPYEYVSTRYDYQFDGTITLPGTEGMVYRKASGVDLPNSLASANLGIVDLSRFRDLSTQSITLRQDDPNGYTINVDTSYGSISINVNEGFWTARDKAGSENGTVPDEATVIATATRFLQDFGISTANYGSARIDQATMMRILAATQIEGGYVEEYINVSWRLLIDGKEVLNSEGSAHGISVTVHAGDNKVTSANIITAKALEGSGYALESDTSRIEAFIARGGMYGWQPETADKTINVAVGEPTLVYTLYGTYDEKSSRYTELYVPALKFTLTPPEGEVFYQSAMVIPLVSEILDNADVMPTYELFDTSGSSVDMPVTREAEAAAE